MEQSQLAISSALELARMKKMQAYESRSAVSQRDTELSDVSEEKMRLVAGKLRPVMD